MVTTTQAPVKFNVKGFTVEYFDLMSLSSVSIQHRVK